MELNSFLKQNIAFFLEFAIKVKTVIVKFIHVYKKYM